MIDRIWALVVGLWVGFKDWVVSLFKIQAGNRIMWPKILNYVPGVSKGNDFATSGEAFVLIFIRDYILGTFKWAWRKLTAVPAYLFSPLSSYHGSGYTWTTLLTNFFRWIGGKALWVLEFLRRLF